MISHEYGVYFFAKGVLVPRTKQNQVEKVEQYITRITLLKASGT